MLLDYLKFFFHSKYFLKLGCQWGVKAYFPVVLF